MTIHLPEDVERSILAEVHCGRFASVDDAVAAAWRAFEQLKQSQAAAGKPTAGGEAPAPAQRPAWERVLENMETVPDEVFDRIPADSSAQLDHYLYGTPKRPTA